MPHDQGTTRLTITLCRGAEPIEGLLQVGDADPTEFRGWLQLVPLIEAAAKSNGNAPDEERR
ncbi:MAG: hypothetical protein ACYDGN_01780 [Acidimicrobiales bacterium]